MALKIRHRTQPNTLCCVCLRCFPLFSCELVKRRGRGSSLYPIEALLLNHNLPISSTMGLPGTTSRGVASVNRRLDAPNDVNVNVREQVVDHHHHDGTEPVFIKIEEEDDDDDDDDGGTSSELGGGEVEEQARPMEGLREAGPSPFLKKTFEMVEDPESDAVVSWKRDGRSFVVWDYLEFSKQLLPKFFKHNNFSSFIRQLNTYGFRKIDPDQWDFAHEFFRRGKKLLLKNIRRRVRSNHPRLRAGVSSFLPECKTVMDVEAETEILKKEHEKLRMDILNLRQEQEIFQSDIVAMEERIHRAENRHKHMFLFFAKAVRNPNFIQQLTQMKRSSETRPLRMAGLDSIRKRPRLQKPIDPEASKFVMEVLKLSPSDDNQESGGFLDSSVSGEFVGGELICRDHESVPSESTSSFSDMSEAYQVVSDNLLGDSGINLEKEDVVDALQDSNLYLEFEGLIGKSRDWEGYGDEFLEPIGVEVMP